MKRFFVFFLALTLSLSALSSPETIHARGIPYHVFIIAGQSNASGAAQTPANQETNTRIIEMGLDGTWGRASEPTNIYANQGPVDSYSFGMSFALRMIALNPTPYKIALINCAVGGSSIGGWQRGSRIYDECLTRAKYQQAGVVDGIIFAQGESETLVDYAAQMWAYGFERFAMDFREDLGYSPPFILVSVAKMGTRYAYRDIVFDQQILAASRIPDTVFVDASDITSDGLHYDTAGQMALGARIAEDIMGLSYVGNNSLWLGFTLR